MKNHLAISKKKTPVRELIFIKFACFKPATLPNIYFIGRAQKQNSYWGKPLSGCFCLKILSLYIGFRIFGKAAHTFNTHLHTVARINAFESPYHLFNKYPQVWKFTSSQVFDQIPDHYVEFRKNNVIK